MKVVIRNYEEADKEKCRSLWRELAEWHQEIYEDPTIGGEHPEDYFDKHLSAVGPEKVWVAVYRSEVIGFAALIVKDTEAEIEPIIINKMFRGRGVGTQLIEAVILEAKKMKIRHLNVAPVARNTSAIDFYYKLGFVNVGQIEMFMDFTNRKWKSGLKLGKKEFDY